jgi:hypothetical protein
MLKKNFLIITLLTVFLAAGTITNAQENPTEKKDTKMVKQYDDMQKCMDKIAADSTMRMQMMVKMTDQCKGNKEGMMQMCKTMMDNPEMHKTMMKMMEDKGMMKGGMMNHDMKYDSTKTMKNQNLQ